MPPGVRATARNAYLDNWPKVTTRLQRPERDYLQSVLRSQGITFAEWIRRQLSTSAAPSSGTIDPKVDALSMKLPEEFAQSAHDALIAHAEALMSLGAIQKKDSPLETAANRRKAGRYIDAAGYFSGALAKYRRLHEAKEAKAERDRKKGPPAA